MKGITVFLWFDGQAEEAADFYTSLFPNSKITDVARYGDVGPGEPGAVMTVAFELDGRKFVGLNGGPQFTFNEAVSFAINCETQAEVDEYWERLGEGGEHGPCGWLKDRYGVSWQVVPTALPELLAQPDREAAQRVMATMLTMSKLDIEPLRRAAEGREPVESAS
jgi:predicted 3-demethylubiquinone-9 3-methyltransferase (glyoxalase superfamily)